MNDAMQMVHLGKYANAEKTRYEQANEDRLNENFRMLQKKIESLQDGIRKLRTGMSPYGSVNGDLSIDDVLDVVPRRCNASLSSPGWYRVMRIDAGSTVRVEGGLGAIVNFNIIRRQGSSTNEVHEITLDFVRIPALAFVNENSKSGTRLIDKIRYNTAGTVGYIDIHYTGTVAEEVAVCFDVNTLPGYFSSFTAEPLQSVADAPSGETVLTAHTFSSNITYIDNFYTDTINGTMGVEYRSFADGSSADISIEGNRGVVLFVTSMAGSGNCICVARANSAGTVAKTVFNPYGYSSLSVSFTTSTNNIKVTNSTGVFVFVLILRI